MLMVELSVNLPDVAFVMSRVKCCVSKVGCQLCQPILREFQFWILNNQVKVTDCLFELIFVWEKGIHSTWPANLWCITGAGSRRPGVTPVKLPEHPRNAARLPLRQHYCRRRRQRWWVRKSWDPQNPKVPNLGLWNIMIQPAKNVDSKDVLKPLNL